MAQATRTSQDNDSAAPAGELDASVGELIDQLAPESSDIDGSLDLTPDTQLQGQTEDGLGEAGGDSDQDLLETVQALLREVPTVPETPPPASEVPAGLELPADLLAPKAEEAAEPAAPDPEAAAKIETLDEELAGLADELISSEIEGEPEPAPDDAPTLAAAVAAAATPAPAAQPKPAPVSATATERPTNPFTTRKPEPAPEPESEPAPARPGLLAIVVRPLLLACHAASAPVRNKPQHVRDRIGWHALWLAFLGVCVWAYILFFRSPEPPIPTLAPPKQASAEHAPAKKSGKDSHAKAGKDSHAKPAKKQASAGAH